MDDIQFQKSYSALVNPGYVAPAGKPIQNTQGTVTQKGTFSQVLQQILADQQGQLVFSKHALQRIDSRGIQISPQLLAQMDFALKNAREKGIKDALMISGKTAFIVNIPSNTVVTTMSGQEMQNNVFTNIDGAVIL